MFYIIVKKLLRKIFFFCDLDKFRVWCYVIEGIEVIFCVWVSCRKVGKKMYLFFEFYEIWLFKICSDGINFILYLVEIVGVFLLLMKM